MLLVMGHFIMTPAVLLVRELRNKPGVLEEIGLVLPLPDTGSYMLYHYILRRAQYKIPRSPRFAKRTCLLAMDDLSDKEFRRTYRCTRASFDKLLKVLSEKIDLKFNHARKDAGGAIPLRVRLAMTLRFLAGASYLDLCMLYGVASGTFTR